jgi:hypothetical protein
MAQKILDTGILNAILLTNWASEKPNTKELISTAEKDKCCQIHCLNGQEINK